VIQSERLRLVDGIYYKAHQGKGWVYKAQFINPDMPLHVAQAESYLLSTEVAAASAEVVVVYAPHTGTRGGGQSGHARTATGMGLQWNNQHGFLLLAGRGTYAGARSTYPARMVDVAPSLDALLDLPVPHVDGSILADGLFQPPKGSGSRQSKQKHRWTVFMRALRDWEERPGS
jgi:hypothetical protein